MAYIRRLNLFRFEDGEELVFAEFEESVAFAAVELFQVEDILVERDRLVDVINLDRDMIASIDLHAHFLIYICRTRTQKVIDIAEFSYLSVLHRCPLRPNALGVAGSSAAGVRLFS